MSKVDVKVVLLGMADVGKTCLVERFLNGTWNQNTTAVRTSIFIAYFCPANASKYFSNFSQIRFLLY